MNQDGSEEQEEISIRVVYPDHEFSKANIEFKERHESMQAEANEHSELLVEL